MSNINRLVEQSLDYTEEGIKDHLKKHWKKYGAAAGALAAGAGGHKYLKHRQKAASKAYFKKLAKGAAIGAAGHLVHRELRGALGQKLGKTAHKMAAHNLSGVRNHIKDVKDAYPNAGVDEKDYNRIKDTINTTRDMMKTARKFHRQSAESRPSTHVKRFAKKLFGKKKG